MIDRTVFRKYEFNDLSACLAIFDANCPEYFAPNEKSDFQAFLEQVPSGYEVCLNDDAIQGCFGLVKYENESLQLNWIKCLSG